MFEKVSRSLKYDSNIFFDHRHNYIYGHHGRSLYPAPTITRTASNFECITTLLSSQSSQAELYTLCSVLIVSTNTSASNVDNTVTCVDGINSTSVTINDTAIAQNVILNRRSQNVFLQYLFSANIVNNSTTNFSLCGVNDEFQHWQTNSLPYRFTNTDAIGGNRTFLSADQTVAAQQAILIARNLFDLFPFC